MTRFHLTTPWTTSLCVAAVVALGGCGMVDTDTAAASDDAAVRDDAGRRIGVASDTRPAADADVAARVHRLLEAPLTPDCAVRIALINNRDLWAACERLGVARADVVQAGLLTNPVFAGNAKFFGAGQEIELGIATSILDIFHRPLRERIAGAALDATKAEVTHVVVSTAFDVRRAISAIHAADRFVALRTHSLEAASAGGSLMQELHRAGNAVDPDRTAAQTAVARATLDVAMAETAAAATRERLNVLLGLWGAEAAPRLAAPTPDAALPDEAFDHVESRAVAASLDLAGIRGRAEAAAQAAGLTDWEALFPSLQAGAVAKREAADGAWGVGPQISLTLPVFDVGDARRAAAQALLRAALDDYWATAVRVRSAARLLRDNATAGADRGGFIAAQLVPLAARRLRERVREYNAMQVGAFDVLRAAAEVTEVEIDAAEAALAAQVARIDLEELLAGALNPERVNAVGAVGASHMSPSTPGIPQKGH